MPEFELTPFDMILLNTPPRFLKDETKKIKKRIYNKKWKSENPERVKESDRKYRENNREEINERSRNFYDENRDRINEETRTRYHENIDKERERSQNYRIKNSEKVKETNRNYRENNPDKIKESRLNYQLNNPQTFIKNQRKSSWKVAGLNMEHFEEIYEIYISTTHCDLCKVELTEDKIRTKTTRVMDHSHITGEFRNVLCHSCNIKRPHYT